MREKFLNIHYTDYRLARPGKSPLCFCGIRIVNTATAHEEHADRDETDDEIYESNCAIDVYETAAGNYVALITEDLGMFWPSSLDNTLTANSIQELVSKLQAEISVRSAAYNKALTYAFYQLTSDDPQYDETIE